VKALIGALTLCALLAIAGCGDDSAGEGKAVATQATTAPIEKSGDASGRPKPQVIPPEADPPGQLVTNDLIEGTGPEANVGDSVSVHYVGVGYESGREFSSFWDSGGNFGYQIGANMVIPGWDRGTVGMRVGGRREIIVPPELAYGGTGFGSIEPDETLVYVVDLLEAN
jgi:peptidylprolyl isomerase